MVGILLGAFYLVLAVGSKMALGLLQAMVQESGTGVTISSNLFTFMNSEYFLPFVVALVAVKITHRAVKEPHTVKGLLKVVHGALSGVFYYLILGGGIVLLSIALRSSYAGDITTSISLLATLALLEASAGLQILQGVLEYRDASCAPVPVSPPPHIVGAPLPPSAMTCPLCGSAARPTARYCPRCGTKLP